MATGTKTQHQNQDFVVETLIADALVVDGETLVGGNTAADTLAGTLTGTTDDTLADVADITLDTSDTYTDAAVNTAVNTAIAATNLQLKELQEALNSVIAALQAGGYLTT